MVLGERQQARCVRLRILWRPTKAIQATKLRESDAGLNWGKIYVKPKIPLVRSIISEIHARRVLHYACGSTLLVSQVTANLVASGVNFGFRARQAFSASRAHYRSLFHFHYLSISPSSSSSIHHHCLLPIQHTLICTPGQIPPRIMPET